MDKVLEIKNKLAIEDIVSEYVQLKKAGKNFKACCPFHNEKTPSFVVSPDKGLAYCFGCHKGGDVFQFIQEIEVVDFPEALKILAKKAGVVLDDRMNSEKYKQIKTEKSHLFDIHEKAKDFFVKTLWETPKGKKALEYLKKRGLTENTIKEFKIGFVSEEYSSLYHYLKNSDFTENMLIKSGLIFKGHQGNFIDKFRNRIIFPINNSQGLTIAFTGRIFGEGEPKYLNSPETPIFHKSFVLYGFDVARREIKKEDCVVLVEGQMDVIMSSQAGVKNVVASSGTAFTESHINMIKKITNNLVLALDTDQAGIKASVRAIGLALQNEMFIEMVDIDKKDPADMVMENPTDWINCVKKKKYFLDQLMSVYIKLTDLNNIVKKNKLIASFLNLISKCKNNLEISDMIRKLSMSFNFKEDDLRKELSKIIKKAKNKTSNKGVESPHIEKFKQSDFIRAFLLSYPQVAVKSSDKLNQLSLYVKIMDDKFDFKNEKAYTSILDNDKNTDNTKINQADKDKLIGLKMLINDYYHEMDDSELENELDKLITNMIIMYKKKRLPEITLEIRMAEENSDKKKVDKLEKELIQLIKI